MRFFRSSSHHHRAVGQRQNAVIDGERDGDRVGGAGADVGDLQGVAVGARESS